MENFFAVILFFLESYHIVGHFSVLLRVRLLPRKDLVRIRYYFLFDLLTVFFSSIVFLQRLQWLAVIQMIQHIFYFVTWEKSSAAIKIVSWSSLDWVKSKYYEEWHLDSILGTLFDGAVHTIMAVLLAHYLSTVQIILAVGLVQCSALMILFGPWYAWSYPWSMPKWIERRIRPLSEEECRLSRG